MAEPKYRHRAQKRGSKGNAHKLCTLLEEMMEYLLVLMKTILDAGGPAIPAILMALCVYLGWEKYQLVRQCERTIKELTDRYNAHLDQSHESFMEVVEKYQEGQLDVIQAMNDIKVLVATIGAKLDK